MSVELKYLSKYLPYGLKGYDTKFKTVEKLEADNIKYLQHRTEFKPILHKLSNLNKEIEVNG